MVGAFSTVFGGAALTADPVYIHALLGRLEIRGRSHLADDLLIGDVIKVGYSVAF
jgi:hypothetical protein